MSRLDTLVKLSVEAIFVEGRSIVKRIVRSKGRDRLKLWSVIQKWIWMLRLWNLADLIESSFVIPGVNMPPNQDAVEQLQRDTRRHNEPYAVWEIKVRDIGQCKSCQEETTVITTTVAFADLTQLTRFKAFLRHLFCNWSSKIKVQKLYANNLAFLITYPARALLYFYPNASGESTELLQSTNSEGCNAVKLMNLLVSIMTQDFHVEYLSDGPDEGKSNIEFLKRDYAGGSGLIFEKDERLVLNEVFFYGDKISTSFSKQEEPHWSTPLDEVQTVHSSEDVQLENRRLKERIRRLEHEWEQKETLNRRERDDLKKLNDALKARNALQQNQLELKDEELRETLLEYGRVSVEVSRLTNERKRSEAFDRTFKPMHLTEHLNPRSVSTQTTQSSHSEGASRLIQSTGAEGPSTSGSGSIEVNVENTSIERSVQESRAMISSREGASLTNMPTTTVERSLYNNYKLLLLTISRQLLKDDVAKLKAWASNMFSVNVAVDTIDVLQDLDQKKIISPTDLNRLIEFFREIMRFDCVYLIDGFLLGDYTPLHNAIGVLRKYDQARNRSTNGTSAQQPSSGSVTRPTSTTSERPPPAGSRPPGGSLVAPSRSTTCGNENEQQDIRRGLREIVVADGAVTSDNAGVDETESFRQNNNDRSSTTTSMTPANGATASDRRFRGVLGSNGQKHSKFQRPNSGSRTNETRASDTNDDEDDDAQWLCSHYKRRCHVKFSCCNKYWPCHRCHNNESNCGQKKLRSRDTKYIKCVRCGTEQEFSARSQFCSNCNRKLAEYFCPICKHLTGTDDNPYHCEKCGICRIHRDRSFHCDVCGVCLDVQLRGNHKCRAGSAHDECCICLEDAFTGCQILPCSHKVHKECATQMIRSGITRCPICRESFAHKLERKKPPKKE